MGDGHVCVSDGCALGVFTWRASRDKDMLWSSPLFMKGGVFASEMGVVALERGVFAAEMERLRVNRFGLLRVTRVNPYPNRV